MSNTATSPNLSAAQDAKAKTKKPADVPAKKSADVATKKPADTTAKEAGDVKKTVKRKEPEADAGTAAPAKAAKRTKDTTKDAGDAKKNTKRKETDAEVGTAATVKVAKRTKTSTGAEVGDGLAASGHGDGTVSRRGARLVYTPKEILDQLNEFDVMLKTEITNADKTTRISIRRIRTQWIHDFAVVKSFMRQKTTGRRRVVKKENEDGTAPSTGLHKPKTISDNLCMFMNKTTGGTAQCSRADVTRFLCHYVKTNELQDANARKYICPDAAMQKLFALEKDDRITYPQMQRLLKVNKCFLDDPTPTQA